MHRVADRIRSAIAKPTEWQRIGDQIDAAFIFARSDFVNMCRASHSGAVCEPIVLDAQWTFRPLRSVEIIVVNYKTEEMQGGSIDIIVIRLRRFNSVVLLLMMRKLMT
jgi:hypothetical protein